MKSPVGSLATRSTGRVAFVAAKVFGQQGGTVPMWPGRIAQQQQVWPSASVAADDLR